MTKTMNYIAKDVEIRTDMDEFEWDDSIELAREVIENRPAGADYVFVTASNVDWRGRSGCTLFDVNDKTPGVFWSKIAGWQDADWTLRLATIPTVPRKFTAVAYSHDTPTGGGRIIRFLTARKVVEWLLFEDATPERKTEILEFFGAADKPTLIKMLQNDYLADDVRELL